MIDDLVTTHLDEPYRMFTSRAEHRLFLRADNCYSRLYGIATKYNLLTKEQAHRCKSLFSKEASIEKWISGSKKTIKNKKIPIKDYLKRPEVSITETLPVDYLDGTLAPEAAFNIETKIKYEGYIKNELERINVAKELENLKIPKEFKYTYLHGLSNESKDRLQKVCPETLGQASRIAGIRPTDITLIGLSLKKFVSRET